MKRILIIALPLFAMSCKQAPKLYTYTVSITETSPAFGDNYPVTKEDTVMVQTDKEAYMKGLISYCASAMTKRDLSKKIGKDFGVIKSFKVMDSLGNDVKYKLDASEIDSMNNRIMTNSPRVAEFIKSLKN